MILHNERLNLPYRCITEEDAEKYLRGKSGCDTSGWAYAVPVPEKPEWTPVEVTLNDNHTATVYENIVRVGCQAFTFESIKSLYEAVVKAEEFTKANQ